MGLKMFDLPPGGLADGAVAEVDKENSTSKGSENNLENKTDEDNLKN